MCSSDLGAGLGTGTGIGAAAGVNSKVSEGKTGPTGLAGTGVMGSDWTDAGVGVAGAGATGEGDAGAKAKTSMAGCTAEGAGAGVGVGRGAGAGWGRASGRDDVIGAGAGVRLLRSTPGRLKMRALSGPGCAARPPLTGVVVLEAAETAIEALALELRVLAACWLEALLCVPSLCTPSLKAT